MDKRKRPAEQVLNDRLNVLSALICLGGEATVYALSTLVAHVMSRTKTYVVLDELQGLKLVEPGQGKLKNTKRVQRLAYITEAGRSYYQLNNKGKE